ncbi:pyridoxal phosphate-dependent transferase [Blastocladiella britannica]|nr:pyridoxal phosphate-dependent transferase [Blastocladiella britannica]
MSTYVGATSAISAGKSNITGPAAVAYDFRSDTVTVPTPEMFAAMVAAPVGDDVFNEDPSILALEAYFAKLLNKPAALFCTSGTQANQLAIRAQLALNGGGPPHSVLLDARAHVNCYEAGGIAAHTGAAVVAVDVEGAFVRRERTEPYLTGADVLKHVVRDSGDMHGAPTRLVCLENTCNGSVMPVEAVADVKAAAAKLGVPVHLDGARLWNACVAEGVEPVDYVQHVDSVSVCLSKGIGAPIGSVLVGDTKLVARARHLRKMYGGGWRQAGLLAAAAMHSFEHVYPSQLARSHAEASRLAAGLVALGARIANQPNSEVHTNMVFVDFLPLGITPNQVVAAAMQEAMREADANGEPATRAPIKIFGGRGKTDVMRLVLHYQLADDAVDRFLKVVEETVAANPSAL